MKTADTSFEHFEQVCQDQGVDLHDTIADSGRYWDEDRVAVMRAYTPSGTLAAVAAAGRVLRHSYKEDLATGLIEPSPDFADDTPTRTLIDILNASIEPEPALPDELAFSVEPAEPFDTCSYADYAFMMTALGLGRVGKNGKIEGPRMGSQILAHRSQPAIIRKHLGIPSGLTLKDIKINGIPFPVGSIVSVDFNLVDIDGYEHTPAPPQYAVEHRKVEDIERISFLRLSAFALGRQERRQAGFRATSAASEPEAELFYNAEIEHIQRVAEDALHKLEQFEQTIGKVALANQVAA